MKNNEDTVTLFPAMKTIRADLPDVNSDEFAGVFLPSGELGKVTITDIPLLYY